MADALASLRKDFAAKVEEIEKAHRARVEERRDARLALAAAELEFGPIDSNHETDPKERERAQKVDAARDRVAAAEEAFQYGGPSTDAIAWALWELLGGSK